MKKSRTLRVKQDFTLRRANFAAWGADVVASVLPYFQQVNQTPAVALGKSVGKHGRRAIIRAFSKQRERVTMTASILRAGRCVAANLTILASSCATCGQPAKELVSRIAFFADGRPVEFHGAPRKTVVLCPACQSPQSDRPESGANDALFSGIEEL